MWDSAAFSGIFLASIFSCSQAESTPAHTQVTQTVSPSLAQQGVKIKGVDMEYTTDFRSLNFLKIYVKAASVIVLGVGLLILLAWFLNLPVLKSLLPNEATMKFNTALCFVFSGSSLFFLQNEYSSPKQKRIGQFVAVLILLISLFTLIEYLFGWNLGIDQFFIRDLETPPNAFPGRMSPITAICFVLCSVALLLIEAEVSQFFSLSITVLSLLAINGYIFDHDTLYLLIGFQSIAIHTASSFFILSLAILFSRPTHTVIKALTANQTGSRAALFFLPLFIFLILTLGWLVEQGGKIGLFDSTHVPVILVTALIFSFSPIFFFFIQRINRATEKINLDQLEILHAYETTIEGWSHALDLRDKETEGHTLRVTEMTMRFARMAGITEAELVHIRRGALLHDIGKMGVPDHILFKPDKLTDEEWIAMRKHPVFAFELLSPIAYLRLALDIPYCHHEKWDGSGYPRGLKGEQIPLAARLFAIIDVWDALRSDRLYRQGWSKEKVIEHIKSLSGTHFEPKAVELFLNMMNEDDKDSS